MSINFLINHHLDEKQSAALLAENHIEDEVVLTGSFCIGKCNRVGVTVQVNDDVHVGVTTENFREFFKTNVLDVIENERK